ncbi:RNA-binding domain-containing protein, partial [Caulochytrium protostelioides]
DLYEQELADMKLRVANMQAEAAKLAEIRSSMETDLSHAETTAADAAASKADVDARSVYIGNVDYSATPEELHAHFTACGVIHRVTILCDKFTGHPKGFAYVEFADLSAASNALVLNDSL